MAGGHYTYARVPLGFWMERMFHFTRNHYDRIGHFAQGFVPAIAAREVFLRKKIVKPGPWLVAIVIFGCLGVSALYELFEWVTAVTHGLLRRRVPGHPGRSLGYAGRHVHGGSRRDHARSCSCRASTTARSPSSTPA